MIKKLFVSFLILTSAVLLLSCNDSKTTTKQAAEDDLTGIDVQQGMNLVGKVIYSDGTAASGVVVSDGITVTKTGDDGIYQMVRGEKAIFVYISLPAQSEVPIGADGTPAFYARINQNLDIFRKDFKLTRLKGGVESQFNLYCLADPQVQTSEHLERFTDETVAEIKRAVTAGGANYAITLGDVVYDRPTLMNAMKIAMVSLNIPIFQVIGNHDHNETKLSDEEAIVNFQNNFGPLNYSFNRANTHIVAMDNVMYTKKQTYTTGFTDEQIEWLRQDLDAVPKDKLLIVCMHIPLRNANDVTNGKAFYNLIAQFTDPHIMSGHTHYHQTYLMSNPNIYEHVHGAVCGAWWTGTINADGTPNGYGVYNINNNKISNWIYKATNMPEDFQIRAYSLHSFSDESNYIIANIWSTDKDWKVVLYEDGVKTADMARFTDYDKAAWVFFRALGKTPPIPNAVTGWFRRPDHLYRAVPKSSTSKIEIRATDGFGNEYKQTELLSNVDSFVKYLN